MRLLCSDIARTAFYIQRIDKINNWKSVLFKNTLSQIKIFTFHQSSNGRANTNLITEFN
jgi:hypothetical protein